MDTMSEEIMMGFFCLKCKTKFYWEGEKHRSTICVHCPNCDEHHQFSENELLEVPKGIVNKPNCDVLRGEPDCVHEFFLCHVPAGDSCVPIYHKVCKKCRWDESKGQIMPTEIWKTWGRTSIEKEI